MSKLTIYEKISDNYSPNVVNAAHRGTGREVRSRTPRLTETQAVNRCFNCGSEQHRFFNCPDKTRGPKCFKCGRFGHRRPECTGQETQTVSANVAHANYMHIQLKVNGINIQGLVDTGSDICIVKQSYLNIIKPTSIFRNSSIAIAGLGASVFTKGSCSVNVDIKGEFFDDVIFHVVDDSKMKPGLILGMELLKRAVVEIDEGKILITKKRITNDEGEINKKEDTKEKDTTCFLRRIEVNTENNIPDLSNLKVKNKEIYNEVIELVKTYVPAKPPESPVQMKIIPMDEEPIHRPPRRFPPSERKIIESQVQEWLRKNIISESTSDYASQVVLVKKKDGSHRLCIDYRALNKKIYKDRYPIPNIEDQLDQLQGAKFFTTLDLENGFFHVNVEKGSRKFTSFITQDGQFEFNKMPFGLCNSPGVFQKYINYIFRDLIRRGIVIIYIDDIVIPAGTLKEAMEKLRLTLQVAAENGLRIKWGKCQLVKPEVEYLGYLVKDGKISPAPGKLKAVMKFPTPTTRKQLQSFIGLASYFRKFVQNFALRAKPLTDLLKKDSQFHMEEAQTRAFEEIKSVLTSDPVLQIFKYGVYTELHTDACKDGYGAILLQRNDEDNTLHPIYYMSRKTSAAESKYSSYELEVLAVIEAIKKFRVYLVGQPFKLITDCQAFQDTMKKKDLTTRVARWALLLEEFNYGIEHRAGSRMRHVDALSRNPVCMCTSVNSEQTILSKLAREQKRDERLNAIIELIREEPYKDYEMCHGVLCKKINTNLLYVVPDSLKRNIIREAHEKGHFHERKLREMLEKEFYIPNLKQRIEQCINNCVKCILADRKLGKGEGYLHSIPKGEQPLDTFHVDHLGPMLTTKKNYRYIFAVIDSFTKFCWLFPTKTLNAEEVMQKLEVIAETFGYPRRIVADHGGAFISTKFQEYCKAHDVKLHLTTVGVPRGNGQVERLHATVIPALTKLSIDDTEKWYLHIKPLQQMLNSTYHRSINMTPLRLLVGTEMKTPRNLRIMEIIEGEHRIQFENQRTEERDRAKLDMTKVQEENRRNYNKKRKKAKQYKVGDLVAIERVQFGTGLKIKPKFLGPYRITGIKGFDRYKLQKEGEHEGPNQTGSSADKMKPWAEDDFHEYEDDLDDQEDNFGDHEDEQDEEEFRGFEESEMSNENGMSFEPNDQQDGRNVGNDV